MSKLETALENISNTTVRYLLPPGDETLRADFAAAWNDGSGKQKRRNGPPRRHNDSDPCLVVKTSDTSGPSDAAILRVLEAVAEYAWTHSAWDLNAVKRDLSRFLPELRATPVASGGVARKP
jgi:hypothetical protein